VLEGHLCADHVRVYIAILLKYAVAQVVGYIKGKSAIQVARTFAWRTRNFTGENFLARRYFASTVGRDEEVIRKDIQDQERIDCKVDQLNLLS